MWSDNETDRDFLNFSYVADIAAEMIVQADGRPLSMGISGSWGVGKSSLMKLLAYSLKAKSGKKFLFVEFNAWLYQGYDDTRAALMEIIARKLVEHAEAEKGVVAGALDKAKSLLGRVNWFRLASVSAATVASLAAGLPPVGLLGAGIQAVGGLFDGHITQKDIDNAGGVAKKAIDGGKELLNDKKEAAPTPPKAIHDFRDDLAETLKDLGVTLVVLIDDLDRCLPPTAIATLEAMRLFLFLDHTAFIIAADDKMIRESVRAHFKDAQFDDDLITNYFDKLIQVPIRVPPLGTQEVRAYLMMLFIENSSLPPTEKEKVRAAICKRLGETWSGKRVDRSFVSGLIPTSPSELLSQLDLADRIAPILTTAKKIAGNPRLIKRFLNTLSIRMSIARLQSVSIDEAALAKMLLFERCGSENAYAELLVSINESDDGKSALLQKLESSSAKLDANSDWSSDFAKEWLALQPPLADVDLRGVVYVSREHMPIISSADRISSEGKDLLEALIVMRTPSTTIEGKLKALPPSDLVLITEKLLGRARSISSWGTPDILNALLAVASVSGEHLQSIVRFLKDIPTAQLTAPIVPRLSDRAWAEPVLLHWKMDSFTKSPVKKAIEAAMKKDIK